MGIQQRLLKARYSEYNLHLSYKQTYNKTNYYFLTKNRKQLNQVIEQSLEQILYPVKKDKYYKDNHKKITEDYIKYCLHKPKTNTKLIMNKLILPLVYYIRNKEQFNYTYEHIGLTITTGIVQHMRKAIMRVMILNNELPNIFDRTSPSSNGYYPLYKPMLPKTTAVMRDNLYTIAVDLALKYIEHHKL